MDEFFTELRHISGGAISDTVKCSQQAFSKARSGIDQSIFKECFDRVLDFLCSRDSLDFHARFMGVWGRQIIAVDGSLSGLLKVHLLDGGLWQIPCIKMLAHHDGEQAAVPHLRGTVSAVF